MNKKQVYFCFPRGAASYQHGSNTSRISLPSHRLRPVTVKQATQAPIVLSVSLVGTWVYTLTPQEQQHIKTLIAGKTKHQALQILLSVPGAHKTTIAGIGENEQVPADVTHIHLLIISEG